MRHTKSKGPLVDEGCLQEQQASPTQGSATTVAPERSLDVDDDITEKIIRPALDDELGDMNSDQIKEEVDNCRKVVGQARFLHRNSKKKCLLASVSAFSLFNKLGGLKSHELKSLVGRPKERKGTSVFHRYVQIFEGPCLKEMETDDPDRADAANQVSTSALFWEALNAKYGADIGALDARAISTEIWNAGGRRAFSTAYKEGAAHRRRLSAKRRTASVSKGSGPIPPERPAALNGPAEKSLVEIFDSAPIGEPDLVWDLNEKAASVAPDSGIALLRREGGIVRVHYLWGLPSAQVREALDYCDPAGLLKLPGDLNSWGDILLVGQMIASRETRVPVLEHDDPSAKAALMHNSPAIFLWTEGGDFAIANPRVEASIVLDAKPKADLRLPQRLLWLNVEDRERAQAIIAPPGCRVAFTAASGLSRGFSTIIAEGDRGVTVDFPSAPSVRPLSVRLTDAVEAPDHAPMWTWLVDRGRYKPVGDIVVGPEGIAALNAKAFAVLKGKALTKAVSVTIRPDGVVIDNLYATPLTIPGRQLGATQKPISVTVRGEDLHAVLSGILSLAKATALTWRADPEGILEIEFETGWAFYGAHIPTVLSDSGGLERNPALLKRITPRQV